VVSVPKSATGDWGCAATERNHDHLSQADDGWERIFGAAARSKRASIDLFDEIGSVRQLQADCSLPANYSQRLVRGIEKQHGHAIAR